MGITLDETTCREDILALFAILLGDEHGQDLEKLDSEVASESHAIPAGLQRHSEILTHPVFNRHHSETEMMSYMH
ncbi:hypothetical protein AB4142_38340, partial [Variovorax sp. 2RAF20]